MQARWGLHQRKGALLNGIRRMGFGKEDMTAMFSTILNEKKLKWGFDADIIEAQLAHKSRMPSGVRITMLPIWNSAGPCPEMGRLFGHLEERWMRIGKNMDNNQLVIPQVDDPSWAEALLQTIHNGVAISSVPFVAPAICSLLNSRIQNVQ